MLIFFIFNSSLGYEKIFSKIYARQLFYFLHVSIRYEIVRVSSIIIEI